MTLKLSSFYLSKYYISIKKNPQILAIYFENHINKTFGCLKVIDNSKNIVIFQALVIKKVDLYANIIKKKYWICQTFMRC